MQNKNIRIGNTTTITTIMYITTTMTTIMTLSITL